MRNPNSQRGGTTSVEMIFVVPLLFALLMAAIDFSRVNTIRNTSEIAAYQGARTGILPGRGASDIRAAVEDSLTMVDIVDAAVTIVPSVVTDKTPRVTVTISTPVDSNLYAFSSFFRGRNVDSVCTLTRETDYSDIIE